MEIRATNVNDAFDKGVSILSTTPMLWTRHVSPRGASTLEVTEPVITHYAQPTERVLFSAARDANPFLHFFESLWLLAGRCDVAFLKLFASRMTEFSDDGNIFNGAYGWRWRKAYPFDQIENVISLLQRDPDSRRAVLSMWHVDDLFYSVNCSKDVPCNTQVYVKIREGKLDLTVTCRSNDMLWGAYGTNVVQFSMLQEYLAGKLGVEVGRYTQVSDSFHVYLSPHPGGVVWERVQKEHLAGIDPYKVGLVEPYSLGAGDPQWDADMEMFFGYFDGKHGRRPNIVFKTSFWSDVVWPLWLTWHSRDAEYLSACGATDWRLACTEWLERHAKRKKDAAEFAADAAKDWSYTNAIWRPVVK